MPSRPSTGSAQSQPNLCANCGAELLTDARYCKQCGAIAQTKSSSSESGAAAHIQDENIGESILAIGSEPDKPPTDEPATQIIFTDKRIIVLTVNKEEWKRHHRNSYNLDAQLFKEPLDESLVNYGRPAGQRFFDYETLSQVELRHPRGFLSSVRPGKLKLVPKGGLPLEFTMTTPVQDNAGRLSLYDFGKLRNVLNSRLGKELLIES
jgi:hypothetical protein